MREENRDWMAYIEREVTALCEAKGWGHQIRRKWSVREKPVAESPIDDYEWKLIPDADGKLSDAPSGDLDGVYYVLCFDKPNGRFVLQHDTCHGGMMGPHWEVATYTELRHIGGAAHRIRSEHEGLFDYPPEGWLRDHLLHLTTRFEPNKFSLT